MMCSAFEEITLAVRGIKTSMHYYSTEFAESVVIVLLIRRSERAILKTFTFIFQLVTLK